MVIYKTILALDANVLSSSVKAKAGGGGEDECDIRIRLREATNAAKESVSWDYLDDFLEDVVEAEQREREKMKKSERWRRPPTMSAPTEGRNNYQHLVLTGYNLATKLMDVVYSPWGCRVRDCQVLLKGKDTKGYMIFCFPEIQLRGTFHYPTLEFDELR